METRSIIIRIRHEQDKRLESDEAGSDAKRERLKARKHPEMEESLPNITAASQIANKNAWMTSEFFL
jgi:hypothetical protein